MITIVTKDTYKAAFYMLFGATVTHVKYRKVADNKIKKLGYHREAIITLDHVPSWCPHSWETLMVYGNIHDYVRERERLKRIMRKKYLLTQHQISGKVSNTS